MIFVVIWMIGFMVSFGVLTYADMKQGGSTDYSVDDFMGIAGISALWPVWVVIGLILLPLAVPYFIAKTLIEISQRPKD